MTLVLMYHRVLSADRRVPRGVSVEALRIQLETIRDLGLKVADPSDVDPPRGSPGVLLTFDDGTSDHLDVVVPVLNDFNARALFFVSTAKVGRGGYLSRQGVMEIASAGHTIGAHAHTHARLDLLSEASVYEELTVSNAWITDVVGYFPRYFAPPGGYVNEQVRRIATQVGYSCLRTTFWGYNQVWDPMNIEVLPMRERLGRFLLRLAASRRAEVAVHTAFRGKQLVRKLLGTYEHRARRIREAL